MIPAGGLSTDGKLWIHPRCNAFFLPVKVLSRVFRGKFVAGLKRAFRKGKLLFPGSLKALEGEKTLAAFLQKLFRQDWVVYAKPPFGGPEHVLRGDGEREGICAAGAWWLEEDCPARLPPGARPATG